jgi:hypothetical protein
MQRKSIHEPKQAKDDGHQLQPRALQSKSSRSRFDPPPATQIIDRPAVGRSALTRETASPTPEPLPAEQLIVKLKLSPQKRKLDADVLVPRATRTPRKRKLDADIPIPIPRVTRSQDKTNKKPAQTQSALPVEALAETQVVVEPAAKRRKPNNTRNPPQARTKAKKGEEKAAPPSPNAADLVKTSPRKRSPRKAPPRKASPQKNPTRRTSPRKTLPRQPLPDITTASTRLAKPTGYQVKAAAPVPGKPQKKGSNMKLGKLSRPKKPTAAFSSPQHKSPRKVGTPRANGGQIIIDLSSSSPRAGPSATSASGSGRRKGLTIKPESPDQATFGGNNLLIR